MWGKDGTLDTAGSAEKQAVDADELLIQPPSPKPDSHEFLVGRMAAGCSDLRSHVLVGGLDHDIALAEMWKGAAAIDRNLLQVRQESRTWALGSLRPGPLPLVPLPHQLEGGKLLDRCLRATAAVVDDSRCSWISEALESSSAPTHFGRALSESSLVVCWLTLVRTRSALCQRNSSCFSSDLLSVSAQAVIVDKRYGDLRRLATVLYCAGTVQLVEWWVIAH